MPRFLITGARADFQTRGSREYSYICSDLDRKVSVQGSYALGSLSDCESKRHVSQDHREDRDEDQARGSVVIRAHTAFQPTVSPT